MYYVDTGKRVTKFNFVVILMNMNILLVSFLLVNACVSVCVRARSSRTVRMI